jgi:SSS family solute:Na+ symporter
MSDIYRPISMNASWYAILGLYPLLMFLIGFIFSKKIKDETDFLRAGRRNGIIPLTFTLAAIHFGDGFVMGG